MVCRYWTVHNVGEPYPDCGLQIIAGRHSGGARAAHAARVLSAVLHAHLLWRRQLQRRSIHVRLATLTCPSMNLTALASWRHVLNRRAGHGPAQLCGRRAAAWKPALQGLSIEARPTSPAASSRRRPSALLPPKLGSGTVRCTISLWAGSCGCTKHQRCQQIPESVLCKCRRVLTTAQAWCEIHVNDADSNLC